MPTPLTDADKVLRNDTGIDIATNIASIASALTPSNITDLGDVNLTNPITDGQVIKYDTATQKWVNGLGNITMECTQAQYNAWKQSGQLKTNTLYVLTDAPNLNATAEDLSYDGGATSTHDVIEGVKTEALTCTGGTGVTVAYCTGGKNDKLVSGSIALDKTWSSGWNNGVATLNFKPSAQITIVALNATNGSFYGMGSIDTSGNVNVYVTGTGASLRVALSFGFITA